MDGRKNPIVLWLVDEKGWAYDQIVQNVSAQLPGYRHERFYMVEEHDWRQWVNLGILLLNVDIIVSMHIMYQKQIFEKEVPPNIVMMATGMRLFE